MNEDRTHRATLAAADEDGKIWLGSGEYIGVDSNGEHFTLEQLRKAALSKINREQQWTCSCVGGKIVALGDNDNCGEVLCKAVRVTNETP